MKTSMLNMSRWITVFALTLLATTASVMADDMTALELVKEGNRYIGEQSKDRVVEIRSDKSVGSLIPKIWHVVYYDETATLKAVEVKFIAGKMSSVKRPLRLLEPISKSHEELEAKKLKIDSDKAIKIATKESILENLTITATSPKLTHGESGPVWKVRLWAAKLKDPKKDADLGEIVIDAEKGKVLKNDVNLKRVE